MTASTILTMKMTGSTPGSDQPGMKTDDVYDACNVHADAE